MKRPGPPLLALLLSAATLAVCDRGPTEAPVPEGSGATAVTAAGDAAPTGPLEGQRPERPEAAVPQRPIADYGPPAPTVYFVAGLEGYTEPCGCTVGLQVGGLDRVVGFITEARARQPASLVVDAGNLLFREAELPAHLQEQERLKAAVMLEAHRRLGTVSTTPGLYDLALGLDFYREQLAAAGLPILVANLRAADGQPVGTPTLVREVGDVRLGLVGAVDPALFAARDDVEAAPAVPAVQAAVDALAADGVDTVLLVMQGDLEATRALVAEVPGVDFAIVGYQPAETDEVVEVDGRPLLQAYDQGRYVGLLKLFPGQGGHYVNARTEDRAAVDRVDRRLAYLRNQLALLPPSPEGEPEIVTTMRRQVDDLEREREALRNASLTIPDAGGAYLYWPVALQRGYPEDPEITARMDAYNESLRALHAGRTEVVPLGPGDVAYLGAQVCAGCHRPATDVWLGTPHSWAIQTLEARDKDFDETCVGCHVTGFRQPGGAVTGGDHNGLANVQCEACHGPGGAHVTDPEHGHIVGVTPASTCQGCHSPEHSPHFDYDRYLPIVLGPGHGQPLPPPP